jgi:hypothetical protein
MSFCGVRMVHSFAQNAEKERFPAQAEWDIVLVYTPTSYLILEFLRFCIVVESNAG